MAKRVLTPEQKAHSAAWHKEWRKNNPEKVAASLEKHYIKKAAEIKARYEADLAKIQAELKE